MRYFHTPLPKGVGFEKHLGPLHRVSQQPPLFSQLNCLQFPPVVSDTSRSSSSHWPSVTVTNSREKQPQRKKDLFGFTVAELSVCGHVAAWRCSYGKTESVAPRWSESVNMFSIRYLGSKRERGQVPIWHPRTFSQWSPFFPVGSTS